MIYLASPYSHSSPAIRDNRFRAACRAAGILMNSGHVIFSPIAHTHPIAKSCNLPASWDYWERYDTRIIERCDELWVLMLFGWQESRGVSAEIGIARRLGKPVKCVRRAGGEAITSLWQGGDAVIVDLVEELGLDGEVATVRFQ